LIVGGTALTVAMWGKAVVLVGIAVDFGGLLKDFLATS
jgi:hypothetical protein